MQVDYNTAPPETQHLFLMGVSVTFLQDEKHAEGQASALRWGQHQGKA